MAPKAVDALLDETLDDLEGRYEFIDELGKGASSAVYLARDRMTDIEVAIKVIDLQMLEEDAVLTAVRAEVDLLRHVEHPCIVGLVEVVRDASSLAVVTNALTGGDLFSQVDDGAMTEAAAQDVFAQVALALEHLHAAGYAHRDVKAENICSVAEEAEAIKLIDFGSAAKGAQMTGLVATAAYCAPEVLTSVGFGDVAGNGAPYGPACDLWSLGVLLYFLLSRRLPFAGADEAALLAQVAVGHYEFAPAPAWRGISDSAKSLISRLMTVDPKLRADWAEVRAHSWCCRAIREWERALILTASPQKSPQKTPDAARAAEQTAGDGEHARETHDEPACKMEDGVAAQQGHVSSLPAHGIHEVCGGVSSAGDADVDAASRAATLEGTPLESIAQPAIPTGLSSPSVDHRAVAAGAAAGRLRAILERRERANQSISHKGDA